MGQVVGTGSWGELWTSGMLGRFVLICLGVWLHAADSFVMATILPTAVSEIGGVAYVAWTISLYQTGAIVAGAITAVWCRRLGLKRVMVAAAAAYAFGCIGAAIAPTMPFLLAARFLQGIAGGTMIALSYVAIQQSYAEYLWSRLFAIVSAIWGAGSLLGPLIGGVFAYYGNWRGAFWFFAIQAVALFGASSLILSGNEPGVTPSARFSPLPILLLVIASLLIAQAGVAGGNRSSILLCLAGVALLGAAGWVDSRSSDRLLPLHAFDVFHPVGAGLLTVFALSTATTGFWAYGPLLLKIMFGTQPLASGYILAGEALAWSAATMAVTTVSLSAGDMLIRGGVVMIVVGASSFALVVPAGSFVGMVGCGLLQGVGFGLCWPSIVQRVVRFSGEGEGSLAAAAPGTVQRIGYAVGASATGIAANVSGLADGMTLNAAHTAGFWVFAAFIPILAIGLVGAWRFTGRS